MEVYKEIRLRGLGKFKLNLDKTKVKVESNLDDILDTNVEILVELLLINDETEEDGEMLLKSLDIRDISKEFARLYILTGATYLHTSQIQSVVIECKNYTFSTNNSTYSFDLIQEKLSDPNIKTYLKGVGNLIEVIN